jgi:arabinose-5-phosphate isomerase
MHRDAGVPVVSDTDTVRRALEEIDRKRLGMTCVVDAAGRLCGVVTDGDVRRRTLRVADPAEGTVADAMTRDPVTIGPDALAGEALQQMEMRKITSLPVVDTGDRLVGVIQIHDLWRTELF